ncbi:MAG: gamma-glutamyl-gamma-aminobutyrate hydrolase family protein [Candidatus Kaiserbacteria bacterium]|nr:gamma-glutamyl-gamma-aminobutyrate hydrolase family protein [Candidatus Kaiserbacteria bacterium]MCB9816562.1 gamma-glutamyl-gamma-aminobutyrate hydrolase family protein [Candidatus Nomurabacteria bacterium]
MRAKILTIQFRVNPASVAQEQASIQREAGVYAEIDFISALDESINWNDPATLMIPYQGLILGGSGEFDFDGNRAADDPARTTSYDFLERLRPLFAFLFEHDLPTLGICYGHQLLGAFAGAQVKYDETQKKSCSHEIKLMINKHDYFLFSDLPDSFQAHYGHKDALDRVPEGAVLLMNGGDECKVSALKYKNNIYTTQFHPELTFEDMAERIKNSPGYLPEGVLAEEVFKDDPNSNKILQNFGKFVALQVEGPVTEPVAS